MQGTRALQGQQQALVLLLQWQQQALACCCHCKARVPCMLLKSEILTAKEGFSLALLFPSGKPGLLLPLQKKHVFAIAKEGVTRRRLSSLRAR